MRIVGEPSLEFTVLKKKKKTPFQHRDLVRRQTLSHGAALRNTALGFQQYCSVSNH
jgi:hypothetical protein